MRQFVMFSIALFLIILTVGSIAFILSMQRIVRVQKGNELLKILEIKRIKLETFVSNELSIVLKMADSPLIKRYFLDPSNVELKKLALDEFESYRRFFKSLLVFWVNDIDKIFHFTDVKPYVVDPDNPVDYWYNMTLYKTEKYNFNINYNPELVMMNLWINAPVFDDNHKPIGMVGSGIELTRYIGKLYEDKLEKINFYIFNTKGEITGSMDTNMLKSKKHIQEVIGNIDINILELAKKIEPGQTQSFDFPSGKVAIGSLPILEWYIVALTTIGISDYAKGMTALFIIMIMAIVVILVIYNIFISKYLKSLKKTMESLKAVSKAKSNFLASMSHEIRTPMNAIIGIAQIELQKGNLPKEYETALENIYNSGSVLLGIINDILDMSKIETGKMKLNPVNYDTPSLINDTVQLNISRIGSKPIDFILNLNADLPSKMYGDELRLKQILNNLLSNAIKYTEKGYVKLTVKHLIGPDDLMLCFVVEDTGQGLKPEDQEKLFSEYMRFNIETNRQTEGTGIGLNITLNLVKMMEGTIKVESEYKKGSIFTVIVKQKAVECEAIGEEISQRLRSFTFTGEKILTKMKTVYELMPYGKVLIVDDVETNLYVAEGLMSPYKLNIETVNSGYLAIEKVKKGKTYDVIFMDHMMPLMDGIETTKKLRELGYKEVIVALTANALTGNDVMFKQNGFDDFISKPIDVRHLNAILNTYIRDRHPNKAEKYKQKITSSQDDKAVINPKLIQIFCRDAKKAIATLRETFANDDIKLLTTTAHAMKSALANIAENEMSELMSSLEKAGLSNNKEFITANIEIFIKKLEALIKRLQPTKAINDNGADISEDTTFLTEQLILIKTACENYDDVAAYTILDRLKEYMWKPATIEAIEEIRDALFLHSDFEEAIEQIDSLLLTKR